MIKDNQTLEKEVQEDKPTPLESCPEPDYNTDRFDYVISAADAGFFKYLAYLTTIIKQKGFKQALKFHQEVALMKKDL